MADFVSWRHGGIRETPTWFADERSPQFGWVVEPMQSPADGAVLLCPPVGEEARSSRRTFRVLSQRLAQRGRRVLRLDYLGYGDSAGVPADIVNSRTWIRSVEAGVKYLRACGAETVTVIGMRMGATIAAHAAIVGRWTATRLVLWDPCPSGRAFLREQALLHASTRGVVQGDHEGTVETPGYVFPPDSARALSEIRLPDAERVGRSRLDWTFLYRDDRRRPATCEELSAAGALIMDVPGQSELLDVPPLDAQVPDDALALIVERLCGPGDTVAHDSAPIRQIAHVAPGVTERVVIVGRGLFGIRTEPSRTDVDTAAVFFNVAVESHLGPARLWVTLARRWAARVGITGLRLDVSGVGDSPDLPDGGHDLFYASQWIDDADEVLAEVACSHSRTVAVGVCSGGYAAFEAALRNDGVDVVAINPSIDSIEGALLAHRPGTHDSRRRALREIPLCLHGFAVAHHRLASAGWRSLQWLIPHFAAGSVVAHIVRRDRRVVLAVGTEDAWAFDMNPYWRARARRWHRRNKYSRIDVDRMDHPVLVAAGREELVDALDREAAELAARPRLSVALAHRREDPSLATG